MKKIVFNHNMVQFPSTLSINTLRTREVTMKRTNSLQSLLPIVATIIFILMTACSGGGGTSAGGPTPAVASGEIEALGSVVVNGIRFDTDSAEIEVENEVAGGFDDLQVGMRVEVEGNINNDDATGIATAVRFEDDLEGPITGVADSTIGLAKTMTVLGRTVRVEDGLTAFDDSDPAFTFSALGPASIGIVVEVSGHDLDDGSLQATFIRRKGDDLTTFLAAGGELEIKGTIADLQPTIGTFQIGTLVIDFSGAILLNLENASGGQLADGLLVEVKSTDPDLTDNIMTADSVEVKLPGLRRNNIARAEVRGFVSDLNPAARTFRLNGQLVNFANAAFRGGLSDELLNGVKVEARGSLAVGMINATRITFKESVRFEANLASLDSATGTLTLQGLPGVSVRVDSAITRIDNVGSLAAFAVGNNLRLRARPAAGGGMVAVRLTLQNNDPASRLIVQAPVESFDAAAGVIHMLDNLVTVDTSRILDDDFEIEDSVIGRDSFFSILAVGDIVKARADLGAGDSLTWNQAEIEIEDNRN